MRSLLPDLSGLAAVAGVFSDDDSLAEMPHDFLGYVSNKFSRFHMQQYTYSASCYFSSMCRDLWYVLAHTHTPTHHCCTTSPPPKMLSNDTAAKTDTTVGDRRCSATAENTGDVLRVFAGPQAVDLRHMDMSAYDAAILKANKCRT